MIQFGYLLVGLIVLVVPGLAVQLAAGIRDKLWLAALTVPASVGVFVVSGVVTAIPGLTYTPLLVAVVTLVLAALLATFGWRLRARFGSGQPPTSVADTGQAPPVLAPLSARMTMLAKVAAAAMCLLAVIVAIQPWRTGLGEWSTYPQEHDTIIHTVLVGYVAHTGSAAPWELLPLDMITGEPVSFYPSGLPLAAALPGELAGGPIVGFNVVNALFAGPVFTVGCAALAAAVVRRLRIGSGWTALAGGAAAIVASGMYRPGIHLLHDGGIAPNAAAMSLAPGVIAAILTLGPSMRRGTAQRETQWLRAAVLGLGVAGIFSVHPSVVATVGASVLVFWAAEAFTRSGRRMWRTQWPALLAAGGVAVLAALGQLIGSLGQATRTGNWPPDIQPASLSDALGSNLALAYGGYWDPDQQYAQAAAGALALIGVAAILLTRRCWGVLVMWLFWLAVSIDFKVSPTDGFGSAVGSMFYKSYTRLQSHISLFVPVLAALGVVFVAAGVAKLLAAAPRLPRFTAVACARGPVAAVLAVVVMAGYVITASVPYEHRNADVLAERYVRPEFHRVDDDDKRASAWLAEHIRSGQRVMNSANDGSTYAYIEDNVPVVNVVTLGAIQAPYTFALLKSFRDYPHDPRIRDTILSLNIGYVYVDSEAPAMGAGPGAPNDWYGRPTFTLAPGLTNIGGLPGMSVAYRSGSVTVYKVDHRVLEGIAP